MWLSATWHALFQQGIHWYARGKSCLIMRTLIRLTACSSSRIKVLHLTVTSPIIHCQYTEYQPGHVLQLLSYDGASPDWTVQIELSRDGQK